MFRSLKRVVYQVANIEQAKDWYRKVLDKEPTLDSPFALIFPVGDAELMLTPNANPLAKNDDSATAYWEVDDIDSSYKSLLQSGAVSLTGIRTGLGKKTATFIDPFGNILGIITTTADAVETSVAGQHSEVARGAALVRALAALDEREEIKGADYLAEIFLAGDRKDYLKDNAIKDWLIKNYLPNGVYAYSIARTAYFDHIVEKALLDNVPQIVFLGAGYDSRPYRFREIIKETRIFELDDNNTQQRKRELLQQANITIPEQLTYAPISFSKDTLQDNLFKAGFDNSKQSLFVWEGCTSNLTAAEVDETLSFIKTNSPAGSMVCFDYNCLPPEMPEAGTANELKKIMTSESTSETASFGIVEGQIGVFLGRMEFIILEHLTAEELESKYLTLRDGSSVGKVPAPHCIVYASLLG